MAEQSYVQSALSLLETYISDGTPNDPTVGVLRALIYHAPTPRGQLNVCQDIISCQFTPGNDSMSAHLRQVKDHFMTGLIIPMAAKGGATPDATEHPSRGESVELRSVINDIIIEEAKCSQSKIKSLVLRRDNYRSVMSGHVDAPSSDLGLVPGADDDPTITFCVTEAAHILPFSLTGGTEVKRNANVWEVLERFGGTNLLEELNGQNVNRLGNMLTLTMNERAYFGSLKCWFEAVQGQPNTYRVNARKPRKGVYQIGSVVTLTTTNDMLELPDPRYLAIHAACAKVTAACGMAEYIDRVLRDVEELSVLPEDGSSDALMFALHGIADRTGETPWLGRTARPGEAPPT